MCPYLYFKIQLILVKQSGIFSIITPVLSDTEEKKLLNNHYFCFVHKKYSNSFIKLTPDVSWTIFLMSLLPLLALNVEVVLLSMQGQKAQFLQV